MKNSLVIMSAILLSACATSPFLELPNSFTIENVMKIHQGMGCFLMTELVLLLVKTLRIS